MSSLNDSSELRRLAIYMAFLVLLGFSVGVAIWFTENYDRLLPHPIYSRFMPLVFIGTVGLITLLLISNNKHRVIICLVTYIISIPFYAPMILMAFDDTLSHVGRVPLGIRLLPRDVPLMSLLILQIPFLLSIKRGIHYSKVRRFFQFYLIWILLSTTWAYNPVATVCAFVTWGMGYGLYLVFPRIVTNDKMLKRVLLALCIGVVIQGVLCLLYAFLHVDMANIFAREHAELHGWRFGLRRAMGTTMHPGDIGLFFALMIPIFFSLSLSKICRYLGIVGLFAGTIGLMASKTRASIASVMISIMLIVVIYNRRKTKRTYGTILIIFIVGFLIVSGIMLAGLFWFKYSNLADMVFQRVETLYIAGDILRHKNVWLTGVGGNNYVDALQEISRLTGDDFFSRSPVHNLFVLEWAETGIVGLVLMLGLYYYAMRNALRASYNTPLRQSVRIGLAGSLCSFLVVGLTSWSPGTIVAFGSFVLLLGLLEMVNLPAMQSFQNSRASV